MFPIDISATLNINHFTASKEKYEKENKSSLRVFAKPLDWDLEISTVEYISVQNDIDISQRGQAIHINISYFSEPCAFHTREVWSFAASLPCAPTPRQRDLKCKTATAANVIGSICFGLREKTERGLSACARKGDLPVANILRRKKIYYCVRDVRGRRRIQCI